MAGTQAYPGASLDPPKNEIRVLRVLPGALDDHIEAELEVVSLDVFEWGPEFGAPYSEKTIDLDKRSQPRGHDGHRLDLIPREGSLTSQWYAPICGATPCRCYEALSYTWDPKGRKQAITLNGLSGYMVMENLFRALRRLRWEQADRILWVDALCISQVDDAEKADQVRLMSRIFSSAARVVTWLGDTEDAPRTSMRSMFKSLGISKSGQKSTSSSSDSRVGELHRALLNAERFWWERTWIIQEFVLATNAPVFCFGSNVVEDTDLLDLLNKIGDHQNRHPLRAALNDLETQRSILKRGAIGPITRQIGTVRRVFATDPRDKVFSILGMIEDREARKILVDYKPTYTVAQAFARATCISLETNGGLGPLKHVEFRSRDTSMPSWAIDFDCSNVDLKQFTVPSWSPWRTKWCNAHRNSEPWDALNLDTLTLELRGYKMDKIVKVIAFPLRKMFQGRFDGEPIPPQPTAITELIQALQNFPPTNPYHALDPQCLDQSIRAPTDWTKLIKAAQKPPAPDLTAFRWLEKLFYAWAECLSLASSLNKLKTDRVGLFNEWVRYAQYAAGDTVAFTTEKGFFGMAPSTIQAGDEVALLVGSTAPTLLRPAGPDWTFRGFGHVWGISAPNSEPLPNMLAALAPHVVLPEQTYRVK